jgi:hypothetical protein
MTFSHVMKHNGEKTKTKQPEVYFFLMPSLHPNQENAVTLMTVFSFFFKTTYGKA